MRDAPEPRIIINNHQLSEAQAMAVRVAICSFESECNSPDGRNLLGKIADGYRDRLGEVLALMSERV